MNPAENHTGEFSHDDMHYFIFKTGMLSPWVTGVSGGYKEDSLVSCGHSYSEMKKYNASAAERDCIKMFRRIQRYWMKQAEQYEKDSSSE